MVGPLIILLIFIIYLSTVNNDEHLHGYWIADDNSFTEKADIKSMLLFIGENESWLPHKTRECYLVISNNVANEGFTMKYWKSWNCSKNSYVIAPELQFDENDIFPSGAEWKIDVLNGLLTIIKDDKTYAELHKDHTLKDI